MCLTIAAVFRLCSARLSSYRHKIPYIVQEAQLTQSRWVILRRCLRHHTFSRFTRTATCDIHRQTHRHTHRHRAIAYIIYRAKQRSHGKKKLNNTHLVWWMKLEIEMGRYFIDVQIPVSVSALDRPTFDRSYACCSYLFIYGRPM